MFRDAQNINGIFAERHDHESCLRKEEHPEIQQFHPFTTTLIELLLSREPIPLQQVSDVLKFVQEKEIQSGAGADVSGS